jgi:glutathione S-transferase
MLALYHNDISTCSQKVRLCLAEKGLEWQDRHLNLRAGEHQQAWYIKLNRRAVVPTLVDGDKVIPESNVIIEYLDEAFPEPRLRPEDPYGRAMLRLWTKQLDEDIHDAGIAVLTFAVAFRHQYLERGDDGKRLLERVPTTSKRERRRDVIERGIASPYVRTAVARLEKLFTDMEEALLAHRWLIGEDYTLADLAYTPYLTRIEHLNLMRWLDRKPRLSDWFCRIKARSSYAEAIDRWENPDHVALMQRRGAEDWPKLETMLQSL